MKRWIQESTVADRGEPGGIPPAGGVTYGIMAITLAVVILGMAVSAAVGQQVRIDELTVRDGDTPTRLVGYGLVIGLDGTGDRVLGGLSGGHTVRSVANLLRRFDVRVPEDVLRTRNVAAVLVTAETSPYLRPGGRFDIHVASVGDATSLRGGVLWMTPLQTGPGTTPVATAQGPLIVSDLDYRDTRRVQTTAMIPSGGVVERSLPIPDFGATSVLYLREPDLATASRIAARIVAELGEGTALVDDPGSVRLVLPEDPTLPPPEQLAAIGELTVTRGRRSRVIIDSRAGTVIAGGDITIGEAVVSHESMTLSIGGPTTAPDATAVGDIRMDPGVTVQDVAVALYGVAAPPSTIAAVFESLRQVGALTARVTVR